MIKVISYIIWSIVIYLAIGAIITRVKLPQEDRKGLTGCSNLLFGSIFWPVIILMVLMVKMKNRKNK